MRILGIDPGYAIVGFGALDYVRGAFCPVQYGAITTQAHTLFEQRLEEIYFDMTQLLQNQTTAMAVAQARGVLLLCAQLARVPVFEYTPMQVKQSVTGYGKATKKQVQEMTRTLLRMQAVPKPDDAADALALAICHGHSAHSRQYGLTRTRRQQLGYD